MKRRPILFLILAVFIVIALVIIIVRAANDPPTAESNIVTTDEDTPVSITLAGNDPDGEPLTYRVLTSPSHGRVSGTEPHLIYTPDTNFNGPDSLIFKVSDGMADSAAATVSITVTPVNDAPVAHDDIATTQEDAPVVTIDVLANDTDADNDRLMVISATQGSHGSVTINTDSTLTYVPNADFCGTDAFGYTVSDGKGQTGTTTVEVTVNPVNDAPQITSKPVTTTTVWTPYRYDVSAKDADPTDTLTYSLTTKPEGMTIDPATGRIEWRPTSAQAGTYDVLVEVADSNSVPASDTQSFTITVPSLSSPLTTILTVEDCYDQRSQKTFSAKGKITAVQASDNDRWETEPGSYICYDFCDASVPTGASIISVVVYMEHFEEEGFPPRKLQWCAGTGWPAHPAVWASIDAPVREGEGNEATDSWDITSAADTPDKIDSLQLQIKNNNISVRRKTSVDYLYAVVRWY